MNILLASSEIAGFAKTGGLADVCADLPRALAERGQQIALIMPLFRSVRFGKNAINPTPYLFPIPLGDRVVVTRLWKARLPNSQVPVYLVENEALFERDNPATGAGLYQFTGTDGNKYDYPDNCLRFTFFCRAVLEALPYLGMKVDILHVNDWQAGLIPVYLREYYRHRPGYGHLRSLLTVHNLAFQGLYSYADYEVTGLDPRLFNFHDLEFHGNFSFLKGAIVFADWVNTVSSTYAEEITTPEFGCGLDPVLNAQRERLSGIMNGVDYGAWDPAVDPHIAQKYTVDNYVVGKAACKTALQKHFQLTVDPKTPLFGVVARLADQKGIDLVIGCAEQILNSPAQLAILGEGTPKYHEELKQIQAKYPSKVGLLIGFNEGLAHRIEAGADFFLMPSKYEPAGLNQMYSLRYGTPPIVRHTGGLADTITNATLETIADGSANGFSFHEPSAKALFATIEWALELYHNQPQVLAQIIQTGMRQDWSWLRSAAKYEALYGHLAEKQG